MMTLSNISVVETLKSFKAVGLKVTFLVPTKTGLEKSIMDATKALRDFLLGVDIHNFENQRQGTESKILIPTKLLSHDSEIETETSLYRPETKSGDPRIWIYKLNGYADPGDLLAILSGYKSLVVINCSKTNLKKLLDEKNPLFIKLFSSAIPPIPLVASELLSLLRSISSKGYIKTLRSGDTGVGYTLETHLGIKANSSRAPDYKGIEVKSIRQRSQNKGGRSTVLSKTPDWEISNLKGSRDILYTRGRINEKKGRMQLFHQFDALKLNSYSMKLIIDDETELLHQIYTEGGISVTDVSWKMHDLKSRFLEKHKETFWVSALTKGKSGDDTESFLYSSVRHTREVDVDALPTLIELGVITVDYTITEKRPGVAKDQGYLFKISSKNLDLLFLKVDNYSLQ